jgi:hypothetical protein
MYTAILPKEPATIWGLKVGLVMSKEVHGLSKIPL